MAQAGKLERLWIDTQERVLNRLDRIRIRKRPTMPHHLLTGLRGERAALFELRRRGVTIVARRWSSPKLRGDIDLIGWDGETLCFIEVKTRTARDMTPAEVAVDDRKRDLLRSLARAYLNTFPESERNSIPTRFDIVSVYAVQNTLDFEIFRGAFSWR
ncbi:MAG TPA: YraN family protein [Acidobacteriaceae bacterium]|nr:YraN family protein [Acidobacteriaceae bacterium]